MSDAVTTDESKKEILNRLAIETGADVDGDIIQVLIDVNHGIIKGDGRFPGGSKALKDFGQMKRTATALATLVAVMFVIIFIMGIGLIRNQDRIYHLENTIQEMRIEQE